MTSTVRNLFVTIMTYWNVELLIMSPDHMSILTGHVDDPRKQDSLKRRAIALYKRLDNMLQKPVDKGMPFNGTSLIFLTDASLILQLEMIELPRRMRGD